MHEEALFGCSVSSKSNRFAVSILPFVACARRLIGVETATKSNIFAKRRARGHFSINISAVANANRAARIAPRLTRGVCLLCLFLEHL